MKLVTYYIGDNTIEIQNSILGKETVKLNGEIVSQKSSIFGAEHPFKIYEDGVTKDAMIKIGLSFLPLGIQVDLLVDNKPIVKHSKSKQRFWIILGVLIFCAVVGFLLGLRDR